MNAQESTHVKRLELTRGYYALLDAEDYEFASRFRWRAVTKGKWTYAYGRVDGEDMFMHRALLKAKPGEQVDHENSNGLDNRRRNLRLCTQPKNSRNQKVGAHNTTGFKGVRYSKRYRNWRATIGIMNRNYSLGSYATKIEAAIAYNIGSVEFHGPFARLNDVGKLCRGPHSILGDLVTLRPPGINERLAKIRGQLEASNHQS
ncbi:MAG: HNH endonuclease [Verrucomicrobia bacterium]|nr:HNH endonuclease [Verrucomicrobiota bacterium]